MGFLCKREEIFAIPLIRAREEKKNAKRLELCRMSTKRKQRQRERRRKEKIQLDVAVASLPSPPLPPSSSCKIHIHIFFSSPIEIIDGGGAARFSEILLFFFLWIFFSTLGLIRQRFIATIVVMCLYLINAIDTNKHYASNTKNWERHSEFIEHSIRYLPHREHARRSTLASVHLRK